MRVAQFTLLCCVITLCTAAASERLGRKRLGSKGPKTDHESLFGRDNRCVVYVLNHYGFLWNIVRSIVVFFRGGF